MLTNISMATYGSNFRVSETKNENYPRGKLFIVTAGWQDKIVINPANDSDDSCIVLPNVHPVVAGREIINHPSSIQLGVAGMPG